MQTYIWILAGILLIIAEFAVPGFIIFFFGVSAIIVGILQLLFPAIPLYVSLIVFAVLGAVLLFAFRRFMPKAMVGTQMTDKFETDIENDDVIGQRVTVIEAITPEAGGKVELHGTSWNATADKNIPAGTVVTVKDKRNLTLIVE